MKALKPIKGIVKVGYSVVTVGAEGKLTFATPKVLPMAKKVAVSKTISNNPFYADSQLQFDDRKITELKVALDIADLSDEDANIILGYKLATEGGYIENQESLGADVALLIEAKKANSTHHRFIVLYNGQFVETEETIESDEGGGNYQIRALAGTFKPNGDYKYVVDSDSAGAPADLSTKFWTAVIVPTEKPKA